MNTWDTVKPVLLGVCRRRKRLALFSFVAAVLILAPLAYFLSKEPPHFRTSATILVEERPDRIPVFQDFSPSRPLPVQLAILRSRGIAETVIESLPRASLQDLLQNPYYVDYTLPFKNAYRRLTGEPPEIESPNQRALQELQKSRTTFVANQNGLVTIVTEASTPQVALDIANAYIDVLLSRTRSFNIDDSRTSREFLQQQIREVSKTLAASDEALRAFTAAHGGIKVPEQSRAVMTRLSQTESALAEVEANRKIAETRLQALKIKASNEPTPPPSPSRPAAAPAAVAPPPALSPRIQQLRQQLTRLETALLDLRAKYTESHPRVVRITEEIADVQRQLADAVKDTKPVPPSPTTAPSTETQDDRTFLAEQLVVLETSFHSLSAQEEALRKQAEEMRRNLGGLSRDELEYSRLARDIETNQHLYSLLSEKLAGARIREQGEMKVVKVIDPPLAPIRVPSPKRLAFLALALGFAVAVGGGVPAAVEWLRRPVETEDDVRATGLPVLAVIPRVTSSAPMFVKSTDVDVKGRLTESFLFSEAFRSLRAAVQFAMRAERARTILIASPYPTDGKSTVLMNLGLAFREARWRVVVADTDLQRPTLDRLTTTESNGGLIDALHATDRQEVSLSPVEEGMWLAPRGAGLESHTRAMLATDRLGEILDDMASRADVVLCDSSPLLLIPDALFLAAAVDAVILVANAGRTRCRELAQAKSLLESAGTRILGVVINNVPTSALRRYYKRHYRPYLRSATR
jgi:succinoglycan biosynthesis transport protein ExoP